MIVAGEGRGRLRLVTQPDHAWLAAEMLSLFRLSELVDHPRRQALLRGVRLHDNGWRELDAAPPVNPESGAPLGFVELPRPLRIAVWERGTRRYRNDDPYAALLASEHALALHHGRADEEGWRELLPRLAEQRDELLARCALTADELAGDYAWLDLADRLSLAACSGEAVSGERRGFTISVSSAGPPPGSELRLVPFPLAGATSLAVPCRRIQDRHYAGDADLAVSLADARWDSLPVHLAVG